jgi:hypothetical protein
LLIAAVVLAAVPGVALADQAATSSNGQFIDLNVSVTPPKASTAKHPQGVGITFNSFTGNRINGNTRSDNTSITVRFNKGFTENGLKFPACAINPKGTSVCAKKTQIGTGSAEGSVASSSGGAPTFVPAALKAYNGKPQGKNPTVIFIGSIGGKPSLELDFVVKHQNSGPYGLAFDEIIYPGPPAAFDITKFSVSIPDRTVTKKVHGHKLTYHLITAPTSCNKTWKFAQVNGFSSQPALTATATQSCVK